MKKIILLILLSLSTHLASYSQIRIEFGEDGLYNNSIKLLEVMYEFYNKDSLASWIDSNKPHCVFIIQIDSLGHVTDIPIVRGSKMIKKKSKLIRLMKEKGTKFSIVYVNEFGEDEKVLREKLYPEVLHSFQNEGKHSISVGFPGYIHYKIEKMKKANISIEPLSTIECIDRIIQMGRDGIFDYENPRDY